MGAAAIDGVCSAGVGRLLPRPKPRNRPMSPPALAGLVGGMGDGEDGSGLAF